MKDDSYKSKDRSSGKYSGLSLCLNYSKFKTSLFDALRLLLRLPFYVSNLCKLLPVVLKPHLLFIGTESGMNPSSKADNETTV